MDEKRRLPESELMIMQIIWRNVPPVPRAVIDREVGEKRTLAPTTVLTFLARLVDKGFLSVEKRGKANYYTPLVAERDYLASESRHILDRLYGGSLSSFAASLLEGGVSREEVEELRRMLEEGTL